MTVGASMTAETTGIETLEVTDDSETEGMTEGQASSATIEAQATTSSTTIGRARLATTPISLAERLATDVRPHAQQEPVNPPDSAASVPMADLANEAMTAPDSIAPIKDAETTDKAPKTGPSTPTTGPALLARTPTSPSEMPAIGAKPRDPAGGVVGNAKTVDETVDGGRTVDETVDNGRTGGAGMSDAHPPQTTAALRTIKTVSDVQKASAPDTPTTNHPEISENHVNLNAAATTEECP